MLRRHNIPLSNDSTKNYNNAALSVNRHAKEDKIELTKELNAQNTSINEFNSALKDLSAALVPLENAIGFLHKLIGVW